MRDDAYTDPAQIRATYASRGRNAKLNVAKAESLGVNASQIAPTLGLRGSAGAGGVIAGSSSGGGGEIIDATYTQDPGIDYGGGTYEGSLYKQEPIGDSDFNGIV